MNASDFSNAGYRLSLQVSDEEVNRAVTDVQNAYIFKVANVHKGSDIADAIMQLAFILLCQRSTVATRSGGKVKISPSVSEPGYPSQADFENADRLLRTIQNIDGNISEMVDDICGIYYRNKFMSL